MEACVGAHHLSRRLKLLGHDARLMPAKYVRPYSKGQKNDFRDAEAIAEAVQRPTMKFVATKTADQLDLQALHRVRERLVGQRTGIINQIRAFLLERGVAVRQGLRFLRAELPTILATRCEVLSPRMRRLIEDLAGDWRRGGAAGRLVTLRPDIAAAALFYGRVPPVEDVARIRANLSLHYAGEDQLVRPEVPAFIDALKQASIRYELFQYEGARRGFDDDSKPAQYDPAAAKLAWTRLEGHLRKTLG